MLAKDRIDETPNAGVKGEFVGKHVPPDGNESTNRIGWSKCETENRNQESIYDRFRRLYL